MIEIEFSVLSNYPSLLNNECINLAIMFHNISSQEYRFEYTRNWKRISMFNDELDVNFLKIQLSDMKNEIENDLINYKDNYSIKDYTKFYVNELKFSSPVQVSYENFEDFIQHTKKIYLKFDYLKKDRYSSVDEIKYLKRIIKNNKYNLNDKSITGYFNENVTFDFVINNYAFKIFSFKDKKASHLIDTAKKWAYNSLKLRSKYHTVFVLDLDYIENDDSYKTIINILKEDCDKVLNYNELIPFIESTINNYNYN